MRTTWQAVRGVLAIGVPMLVVGGAGDDRMAWAQPGPRAAGAFAQQERLLTDDDREAMGRIILRRAQERLGLSDRQTQEIQTILTSVREGARADMRALREARRELRQLMARQDSDPSALRAVALQVKTLQGQLLDRRLETQLAIRSLLTPEQWARWLELRKEMRHHWMGRGRMGRGGPPAS